jgi:PKD repeat protein
MKYKLWLTFASIIASLSGITQISSTFDTNTDNWHSEGDGNYYWEAATGNPGGCFRVDDDATGDWNSAFAPVQYLGNWSLATTSDFVSANVFVHNISGNYTTGTYVFRLKGPGGEAKAFPDVQPPLEIWNTYTVNMDPSNWVILSGTWSGLLAQVNEFVVRAEYLYGDEYVRIDNVQLSFTPVVVPVVPVLCSDFEDGGFDGWSFGFTAGVSNQATGGNPGHYIRITDGTGTSTAYPPPKYLGDWNSLDNHNADIRTDLKISDFTVAPSLSSYFLKISGPGGVAQFPMDNSISLALNRWKTFVFPVDQAYWTMVSGTWADLMDHVNSFEMVVEFINGTEIVWLDNFCITNLPPIANFNANKQIEFVGNPIQFNDLSIQGPTNWNWDFGDGQTSTEQHPVHTYLTSGLFNVSLAVSNHFGSDTEFKTAYINILPVDQCLKFQDDFNDNTINPLWSTKNGTWAEASGNIRQTSNYYVTGNLLGGCFAMTGSLMWENYILSCDMMSSDNDHIGLVFNWQDELNMYMFYWNLEGNYRRLVKWINGTETILASDAIGYGMNTWNQIEIFSISSNLILAINGIHIFSVTDNTFTTGKAGLFCSGNQSSYWDNVRIECAGTPVQIKAFLEGPFEGTEMKTDLKDLNIIPLSNPYTTAPWNHTGTEGLLSISNPNVVDWVLVDFRDALSAGTALSVTSIATRAALLLKNGNIISPYGGLPLYLNENISNNLYIAVFHRNHLGIISANPVTISGGTYTYDFTTGSGQAYGFNAQKNLADSQYGMYAGDFNADGTIDPNDKTNPWMISAGKYGYLQSDGDLDGQSDNPDKNDLWLKNLDESSQVPE